MSAEPSSPEPLLYGIDNVIDYPRGDDDDSSLPVDGYATVVNHVRRGNRAFRDNRFEEAITSYSKANTMKPNDPIILRNRSAAYSRISQFLKRRPASASEYRPMNGMDPTLHAELGLKDANKLIQLKSNSVDAYVLKTAALILLEKYDLARDAITSGFQIDPSSVVLQDSLRSLEAISSSSTKRVIERSDQCDDFDCTLCLKLLFEPITTPCGHSFCCSCLFQSMDRCNKCPLCRTVLFISPRTCAISVTLNNIIQKHFPKEYEERKKEHQSLTNFGNDLIPLFVMDVVIPCQKFALHIFEPRYRLMVRRILEGNHRMGMVMSDPDSGSIAEFACEVEIVESEPFPDGRFYIEIESRRRFRIIRSWDQDGYRVAEVEWVKDDQPQTSEAKAELQELTTTVADYARAWIVKAKDASRHDRRRLEKLVNAEAMVPPVSDPERFSFWLVTLGDWRPHEKLELLRLRDTSERMKRGMVFLKAAEQGCRLQW